MIILLCWCQNPGKRFHCQGANKPWSTCQLWDNTLWQFSHKMQLNTKVSATLLQQILNSRDIHKLHQCKMYNSIQAYSHTHTYCSGKHGKLEMRKLFSDFYLINICRPPTFCCGPCWHSVWTPFWLNIWKHIFALFFLVPKPKCQFQYFLVVLSIKLNRT